MASLAGVGLLGSSPFTLVGDPATDNLLPTGELTLDGLTGEAPAGIGVLESGPIASGNQVAVDVSDISPSIPVTVCGNGAGALGDASASCGTGQAGSGTGQPSGSGGGSTRPVGPRDGTQVSADGVSASVPVTVCGNGVGLLGDSSSSCGSDTSTGGIIAPPPATTPGGTDTGTSGTPGTSGSDTGSSGGTFGLTPGTSGLTAGGGGAGSAVTSFAPLRSITAAGADALPFTGAGSDLLAVLGATLVTAGLLAVRATRPDTATKGGGDR